LKYGLSEDTKDPEPVFELHGRELFADVAALVATLPGNQTHGFKKTGPYPADLTYKVVSTTQVDISSQSEPKDDMSLYLEDVLWRFDMGNLLPSSSGAGAMSTDASQPSAQPEMKVTQDPPIFDAVSAGDIQRVKTLYSADQSVIDEKDGVGAGPLDSAAFFDKADVASLLISRGEKINAQYNNGGTPLMKAVEFNHVDVIRILLAHGARTGFVDNFGRTALSIAKSSNETDVVHILTAAGATR
jgi:hypothetical protein